MKTISDRQTKTSELTGRISERGRKGLEEGVENRRKRGGENENMRET